MGPPSAIALSTPYVMEIDGRMNFKRYSLEKKIFLTLLFFCWSLNQNFVVSRQASAAEESRISEIQAKKQALDNGLTIIAKPIPQSALATALLIVKTGSATEEEFLGSGISHFVEHMLFKGTEKRKVGQIAQEVEALGGAINGFTAQDYTGYSITLPVEKIGQAIEILSDIIMHSRFDPEELEKEREVILSEIRMDNDDPDNRVYELLFAHSYTRHPYRYRISGYEPLLRALTRDDLLTYYKRMYIPNNMVLVITGGIENEKALAAVKEEFRNFEQKPFFLRRLPQEPEQNETRRREEFYPTQLLRMYCGFKSVGITESDLFALDVLAAILGDGDDSRLYKELYTKKQLVYSIGAFNLTPMDKGLFTIHCTLDKQNKEATLAAIFEQIEKIRKRGVSLAELEKAKKQVLSGYIFSRQTTTQIAYDIALNEVTTQDPDFSKKYVERIQRLLPQDIQAAAKRYLTHESLTVTMVGPLDTGETAADKRILEPLSEIHKVVLDNGLTLLVKEDHRLPLVAIRALYKGGLRFETTDNNGISNLTAQMLTLGTKRRSAKAIAREIEAMGATLNAISGSNSFGLSLDVLTQDVEPAFGIMADCLKNPMFPEDELAKEHQRVLAQIKAKEDDVFFLAFRPLKRMLFKNHPYGFDILGEKESLDRIKRQDILAFYQRLSGANNMVLAIYGDVTLEKATQLVKAAFAKTGAKELPQLNLEEAFPKEPVEQISPVPREQAVIALGFPGLRFSDQQRYSLEVLDAILSSMSGRLFQKIREDIGGAYTLGGGSVPGIERGMYYLYAATTYENMEKVKKIMLQEIIAVQDSGVSEDELGKAKAYLCGEHDKSLETNAALAMASGLDELYGLGYNNYQHYKEKISSVAKEQVLQAARDYLNRSAMVMMILAPQERLLDKK